MDGLDTFDVYIHEEGVVRHNGEFNSLEDALNHTEHTFPTTWAYVQGKQSYSRITVWKEAEISHKLYFISI
jgi:hypothetical protein